jgi:hypothetical protein
MHATSIRPSPFGSAVAHGRDAAVIEHLLRPPFAIHIENEHAAASPAKTGYDLFVAAPVRSAVQMV